MILYIAIIMVLLLVGWTLTLIDDGGSRKFPYGLIGLIVGVFMPITCLVYIAKTEPTALDVYQGKTTLEITYKDGIPVDSVVVFR